MQKYVSNVQSKESPKNTKEDDPEVFKKKLKHSASEVQRYYDHVSPHIGTIEEVPEWLVDNHYILTGYRVGFHKVKDVLRSLFMLHNETTNIWSHLLGVCLFIFLILYIIL